MGPRIRKTVKRNNRFPERRTPPAPYLPRIVWNIPIELSVSVTMFCICAGGHTLRVTIESMTCG